MLEIDNQRLYIENDQLKQLHNHGDTILRDKTCQLEKLINSLQRSNVIIYNAIHFCCIYTFIL
jgi:hypothetical protein